MRKCKICGAKIPVGAPCCTQCGAVDLQKERFDGHHVFQDSLDHMSGNPYEEDGYAPEDIRQNKGMALLSYLGILVFIPILTSRHSPYVRFHANQGLLLFISSTLLQILTRFLHKLADLSFLFFGFGLASKALNLLSLLFLLMAIWGVINVCSGQAKRLPLIGKIRLL